MTDSSPELTTELPFASTGDVIVYERRRYYRQSDKTEVVVRAGTKVKVVRQIPILHDDNTILTTEALVYHSSPDNPEVETALRGHGYVVINDQGYPYLIRYQPSQTFTIA